MERLARQAAEVAKLTVETWPAGVDAEGFGTLPMFTADIDLSERTDSMPWSRWSLTIWSYFGKFNRTTAWVLLQVETRVEDPIITDSTAMTRAEKRFSAQAHCVLAVTCRGKALQVVQQAPGGFGFEAWRQLYEEFEPHRPVKPQGMRQAPVSSTKSDESVQMVRRVTKCRSCSQEDRWPGISPPRKWLSASEQDGCVRRLEARIPHT